MDQPICVEIPNSILEKSRKVLKSYNLNDFKAFRPIRSPWLQTIVPSLIRQDELRSTTMTHLDLSCGDQLVLALNTPETWRKGDRTVILVHGLTGCYQSKYLMRLARDLNRLGYQTVRVNLRGAGPGYSKARGIYHSGRSEDTRAVVEWARRRWEHSPLTIIGYSLGGNISLKMVAEDGARGLVDSVAAVSAPIDLKACSNRLSMSRNRFFDQYFVNRLKKDIRQKHQLFPDLPKFDLPPKLNLAEFDHYYTAPRAGFRSGQEYYEKCSSLPILSDINVPALLLCANDDPIIDPRCFFGLEGKDNFKLVMTVGGGHVGFYGQGRHYWMDSLLLQWVKGLT